MRWGRSSTTISRGWRRYLRLETCKVEDRFAPTFYYVPNALRSLPTFRDESSPASRGNRIFSTAFSSASPLRGRAREKKEEARYHFCPV